MTHYWLSENLMEDGGKREKERREDPMTSRGRAV